MTIEKIESAKTLIDKIKDTEDKLLMLNKDDIVVVIVTADGMISKPSDGSCNDLADKYIRSVIDFYEAQWDRLQREFKEL